MMTKRSIIIGLAALFLSASPAIAAPVLPFDTIEKANSSRYKQFAQRKISPSQAKSIARSQVPGGEVNDIISFQNNTYCVRIIDRNGRVIDIYVDASTGRVKRTSGK